MRTLNYKLSLNENNIFDISLMVKVDKNQNYTDFYMNSNRPGRYILFNYSAGVFNFSAINSNSNEKLRFQKINKDCWRVYHNEYVENITIDYSFYAKREDAGGNLYYKDEILFINPVTCLMNVNKEYDNECILNIENIDLSIKPTTILNYIGEGSYYTKTYHELVDNPILISNNVNYFEKVMDDEFRLKFTFYGNYKGNNHDEFINNVCKIVQEQKKIFGNYPKNINEHHFIYILTEKSIYHALEHSRCSVYYLPSKFTENDFKDLYAITSHEFFHIWNVKSLKPKNIYDFDYSKELYTNLHWLTEGFTDYYADLILNRANITTNNEFLEEMSDIITRLENNPASQWISPSQNSFDSWLGTSEYYPFFLKTSFYTSGKRLAFLIDLKLKTYNLSLDNLFYNLYQKYYIDGDGIPENAVEDELNLLTNGLYDWSLFFNNYVYGVEKIDYNEFFEPNNLELDVVEHELINNKLKNIGINKITILNNSSFKIDEIIPYSDASLAGLKDDDIIVEIVNNNHHVKHVDYLDNIKKDDIVKLRLRNGKIIEIKCSGNFVIKKWIVKNK